MPLQWIVRDGIEYRGPGNDQRHWPCLKIEAHLEADGARLQTIAVELPAPGDKGVLVGQVSNIDIETEVLELDACRRVDLHVTAGLGKRRVLLIPKRLQIDRIGAHKCRVSSDAEFALYTHVGIDLWRRQQAIAG